MSQLLYLLIAIFMVAESAFAIEPATDIVVRGFKWGTTQSEVSKSKEVTHERDSLDITDLLIEKDSIGFVPVSVEYGFFENGLYEVTIETAAKSPDRDLAQVFLDWKAMLTEKYGPHSSERRIPESGPFHISTLDWQEVAPVPAIVLSCNVLNGQTLVVRINYVDPIVNSYVDMLVRAKIAEDEKKKY